MFWFLWWNTLEKSKNGVFSLHDGIFYSRPLHVIKPSKELLKIFSLSQEGSRIMKKFRNELWVDSSIAVEGK